MDTPLPFKRPRIFYVDVIRTWASLMVVASHIFANVCAGMNDYPRHVWWVFNILDSVMRPCAALFVMISGKLLLTSAREESYVNAVWRRCAKLLPPFFVWSMIYAFYNARLDGIPFHPGHAVVEFLHGQNEYHLWFMYVILALYVVAPFLRRFVQSATPNELAGFLLVWFLFLTLQFLFPDWAGGGPCLILINYGGYFILGYLLDQAAILRKKILWPALSALVLVGINAFATYLLTSRHGGMLDEKFYGGATPLVALYAAALFLVLKNIDYDRIVGEGSRWRKATTFFSKESYNVYLMHALFIWLFLKGQLGFTLSLDTGGSPLVGVPLTTAAVIVCSLTFCYLIRKIPVVFRFFVISSTS